MEIYLADEHAYQLTPLISLEVARDRIDKKKMSLVAGTVGALFSQPKPDEIKLVATENRLEPFWFISASTHTEYDRACAYVVPVTGPAGTWDCRVVAVGEVLPQQRRTRRTSRAKA